MIGGWLLRCAVVIVVVVLVVWVARFRTRRSHPSLDVEGNLTGPGVYLLTSNRCDSCDTARDFYRRVLGEGGFTELTWEDHPELLTRLGVAEIPVATVVDGEGRLVRSFVGLPRTGEVKRAAGRRASVK